MYLDYLGTYQYFIGGTWNNFHVFMQSYKYTFKWLNMLLGFWSNFCQKIAKIILIFLKAERKNVKAFWTEIRLNTKERSIF